MRVSMIVVNNFIHDIRVYKEAKTLARVGHTVTVFALGSAEAPAHEEAAGFTIQRITLQTRQWPKWLFVQFLKYVEFVVRVTHLICERKPDVIHAHDINGLVAGWLASMRVGSKLIYDSHELWSERKSRLHDLPGGKTMTRLAEGILIRRADAVITVSESIVKALDRQYPIRTPLLIQNSQEFEVIQRSDLLRQRLDISPDHRIAIYPGNIAPGRGLQNVVRSVPHLDHIDIVIMGSDRMGGLIQRLTNELGVADRVHFLDPVPFDKVNQYVASADVGIMCPERVDLSYYYAAGNKLFHFVMAGIPVVVSDHPDKRGIVEAYGIGVSCDETDPRSIAQALNQVLGDSEQYRQMCASARRAAREELNWRTEERKLLKLYEGLA